MYLKKYLPKKIRELMIIREAITRDISEIAKVHVDTWRTTYRNIFSSEFLANLSYEKRENSWHQVFNNALKGNNFIYVAENESGQIVGFVNAGREREDNLIYRGELCALYILESYQRQGIGVKLVKKVAERLNRMEIDSMLVWVLKDNPACHFYEKLGGKEISAKEIERKGTKLIEIAYGWKDISNLQS